MPSPVRPALLAGAFLLFAACATPAPQPITPTPSPTPANSPAPPSPAPAEPTPAANRSFDFDLRNGEQGWRADYTDYTQPVAPGIDFRAELEERGYLLSGKNVSDDLFMYLRRQLAAADGIVPGTAYQLRFRLTLLSDAPTGCMGIGGPPGERVTIKAGGSASEPLPIEQGDEVVLSIDKGNQVGGGRDASAAGDIANGIECEDALAQDPMPFAEIVREHSHDNPVTAGHDGTLWLLVGTDSGFEGTSTLIWQRIEVELEPIV